MSREKIRALYFNFIYGRKNKKGTAPAMLNFLKDACADKKAVERKPELGENKIIIGELYNNPQPEYTESYKKIVEKFQQQ